jgi:GNAT superfamily N-acetyltransferase
MLFEFESQANAIKRKHLRDAKGQPIKEFYYLWFIATDRPARGQGLAAKVVTKWQEKAASEGQAVWLEATTAKSRDVYARCGFKAVGEISLGKGTHAASGAYEKGGPGVTVWAMLWRPDFRDGKEGEQSESSGGSPQS